MTALRRLLVAWAAAALAGAPHAAAQDDGVCVAISGGAHAVVAEAARRAVGARASIVDVHRRGGRRELAARCGRLVIAVGPEALRAARESAPNAPIVHVMAPGAPPGGPGVSPDADPRRVLDALRKMAPRVRRIGAVYDPAASGELVAQAQQAARDRGMELVALPARDVGEAVRAFHRFEKELPVDALWLLPDGTTTVQETLYYALEIAHWRRMAVIGLSRWYVANGALFALLPTPEAYGKAAGELGRQVLGGSAPEGIVHAQDHALYLNARTADRLGLKLSREIRNEAAEVLQ